ncbi:extracellular matrix regulator RemB [Alteribacillus sp. YIM 98480]|uniref:extracellular matrix regulator RemB n=1 Tax=Alteribacillus sp. YIM 98480 TaxID=2606599 RepID=UPI00131E21EF|nr:extracellular matrix/biofilm biosynthesis regulator RemA family protein [Alteribacillus sp. YIM 98480]
MFIHLGGDTVIRSKDVVAILDQDTHDSSSITKQFLSSHENRDVIEISKELTKSVVVTIDRVYLSPISSLTLRRRAQVVSEFEDYSEDVGESSQS